MTKMVKQKRHRNNVENLVSLSQINRSQNQFSIFITFFDFRFSYEKQSKGIYFKVLETFNNLS